MIQLRRSWIVVPPAVAILMAASLAAALAIAPSPAAARPPMGKVTNAEVAARPEPAAWMMMLVGFGGAGALWRLRRTASPRSPGFIPQAPREPSPRRPEAGAPPFPGSGRLPAVPPRVPTAPSHWVEVWRRAAVGALTLAMGSLVLIFGVAAASDPSPQSAARVATLDHASSRTF